MKKLLVSVFIGASLFGTSLQAQQSSESPLNNASVVKLVKAGFKEKTIIAIIANKPAIFNLSPDQLIQLKREGVSEKIILAMLSSQEATLIINDDEEWASDEDFFKGLKRPNHGGGDNSSSGTTLFGSGGSSQSQTQSNGGRKGNQNENQSTGSVTVRIVKPPVEPGGTASAKFEKTPSLNNEGVIRLVEAGFSEGTIIKRIEESPAEFDLSPAKLKDLQKRRVTEPIIAAMVAAMGSDSKP
jgi:hypothetical protein